MSVPHLLSMKTKLAPIHSIAELAAKANTDPRYATLAARASANLGGPLRPLSQTIQWLYTNAMETDEEGVVEEINFCLDLV